MQRNVLICYPANMFIKLFLISVLLHYCLGNDDYSASAQDRSVAGNLMAYPRLGREVWEFLERPIPYLGTSRLSTDTGSLNSDILLNDIDGYGFEDPAYNTFLNDPLDERKSSMMPTTGRKKRSISDEAYKEEKAAEVNGNHIPGSSDHGKLIWGNLDDFDSDYYFKADKKGIRSKNAFVPRIGKKWSDYEDKYDDKRAAAFTPRIGRASLIPRIGRGDPRFRLKSRASFVPRIGRRAALIPRIGRSEHRHTAKDGTD